MKTFRDLSLKGIVLHTNFLNNEVLYEKKKKKSVLTSRLNYVIDRVLNYTIKIFKKN